MNRFKRIVIVGVGLIGGSIAAALKAATLQDTPHITGIGTHADSLSRAAALGLIDESLTWAQLQTPSESSVSLNTPACLQTADLIVLAMPVSATHEVLSRLRPHLADHTLLTDTGSVKQSVIAQAQAALGVDSRRFIPGHPIAGSENKGPEAAQATLFNGKYTVLTPLPDNTPQAVAQIEALWRHCGAEVKILDARQHDEIFAAVSHLPHLLAFAYMAQMTQGDNAALRLQLAGSGFRDFTRIAASPAALWRDIILGNRDAVRASLNQLRQILDRSDQALAAADGVWLQQLFAEAGNARTNWPGWPGGSEGPGSSHTSVDSASPLVS